VDFRLVGIIERQITVNGRMIESIIGIWRIISKQGVFDQKPKHIQRRAGAFRADFSFPLTIVSITSEVGTRELVAQFAARYAARQFLVADVARQHRLQHKIWLDRERELVKPSTRKVYKDFVADLKAAKAYSDQHNNRSDAH
jgi:hypothetical protein